jgi:hypothetical protein
MPTVKESLVTKLKLKAAVVDTEAVSAQLGDFLDDALTEHAPRYAGNFDLLPANEYEPVLLLGWERACLTRASLVAPQSSARNGQSGFGADRDTPFEKNTKLAKILRDRYITLTSALIANGAAANDETAAGDITLGDFYRNDERWEARVPFTVAPTLTAPTLTASTKTAAGGASAGSVVLLWDAVDSPVFYQLNVVKNLNAGIYQQWNADGANLIPFIATNSTTVYTTNEWIKKGIKVTGLTVGSYYFIIAVQDTSGHFIFSNEVLVAIAA